MTMTSILFNGAKSIRPPASTFVASMRAIEVDAASIKALLTCAICSKLVMSPRLGTNEVGHRNALSA